MGPPFRIYALIFGLASLFRVSPLFRIGFQFHVKGLSQARARKQGPRATLRARGTGSVGDGVGEGAGHRVGRRWCRRGRGAQGQ